MYLFRKGKTNSNAFLLLYIQYVPNSHMYNGEKTGDKLKRMKHIINENNDLFFNSQHNQKSTHSIRR